MSEQLPYHEGIEGVETAEKAPATYEKVFEQRKELISDLIEAYKNTPHGSKVLRDRPPSSYIEFRLVPVISADDIKESPEDEFVTVGVISDFSDEKYIVFSSGGTTSQPKHIYRERNVKWVDIPPVVKKLLESGEHPVLIHQGDNGTLHRYMDSRLQEVRNLDVEPYNTLDDFIVSCVNSDTPYYMDLVGTFRELFYEIKREYQKDPNKFAKIGNRKLHLDLSGSQVHTKEMDEWHDLLSKIFKQGVEIVATYGLTETGEFGTYLYKKGDKVPRYKISKDTFLEVLDEHGNPVVGQEGRVVASRYSGVGTILPRYETGDLGTLEVDQDGEEYMVSPHRNPEKGMIDIFGHKVFIGDVYDIVSDKLRFPFKLLVKSKVSPDQSKMAINIEAFSKHKVEDDSRTKDIILGSILFNNRVLLELMSESKVDVSIDLIYSENLDIKDWAFRQE